MKTSELIEELTERMKEYGDRDVSIGCERNNDNGADYRQEFDPSYVTLNPKSGEIVIEIGYIH